MAKFAIRVFCLQHYHEMASFGWYDDPACNDSELIEVPSNNRYAYADAAQVALESMVLMWRGRYSPLLAESNLYVETRSETGVRENCWGNMSSARKKWKETFSYKD